MKKFILFTICILFGFSAKVSFAQRGPGGVTDDSDEQKNCRLWLDAGDLNFSDQTDVSLWQDRSVSSTVDEAFWDSDQDYLPPIFRNDPSNGINGKPVVSFEEGGMLSIGTWPGGVISPDLNSNVSANTTYEQSIFMVFRTSNDVTSRQILWEEGGSARGFNIQIINGFVQIGAYDDIGNDDDLGSSSVPEFGFTYKRLGIQPNTTYVISLVYDVRTDNILLTNANIDSYPETGLTGTLNGLSFPSTMVTGCCENDGVGGIATHPDPIGIGGINRTSYNENGPIGQSTGTSLFTGRLAEICYYAFSVSPCQRVIIENYLAAKYFANVIANDKYDYQTSFGDDVIGIGKEDDDDQHNVSQGDNLFEISADMDLAFPSDEPYYLMVGHNNSPISWTDDNVPDTLSFQRLRRTWRFDRRGPDDGEETVHIEMNENDLPLLPAGFTKYGVIVDNSNGSLPNFSGEDLQIVGLSEFGNSGIFECDIEIVKGSYLAVVAIQPTVNFNISSKSVVEGDVGDPVIPEEFTLQLNYTPSVSESFTATILITDGTAIEGNDYTWNSAADVASFIGGDNEQTKSVTIVDDDVAVGDDAIEDFYVEIVATTGGLFIGLQDSITYKILDNDPPPKLTFSAAEYSFNEGDGVVKVPMEIVGDLSGFISASADIIFSPSGNTASENIDYSMVSPQVLNFTPSVPRDTVLITIINDELDEINETFRLEIQSASGIAFSDTLNINPIITIVDNDNPPTVSFLATESEGYEGVGDPRIYVELSAPSSRQIVVPFRDMGTGSATRGGDGADYNAEENSSLIIPPGDTLSFIYYDIPTDQNNLIVISDLVDEGIEDAVFELLDNDTLANAQLGTNTIHTYNIKDYVEFENKGVAGIGKDRDNTIVMIADEAINTSSVPNLSPRNIEIIQSNSNWRPALISAALNEKKVLRFDGTNDYLSLGDPSTLGQSSLINTAGLYDGKSIFLVITPHNANSSTPQTIYEQGAQGRGLSLYIQNNRLYFQGWNNANDGAYSPWGHNSGNYAFAVSAPGSIQNNQTYIVSAHFVNNMIDNPADSRGLKLYVNGSLAGSYSGDVGRLYAHGGRVALGGVHHGSWFIDGPFTTGVNDPAERCFDGDIAEMIYYNEPNELNTLRMNEPRINIIHNHLSAKYNIALDPAVQYFNTSLNGDASTSNFFGNDVAGIAEIDSKIHGDARGKAEIRVTTPNYSGSGDFYAVWGHQGDQLTDTWPVSYWNAPIQSPIQERSGRIWKFFTNAADGTLTAQIEIDYSASDSADQIEPDEDVYLRLLVHSNSDPTDFSSLDDIIPAESSVLDGNTVIFTDVPITNGMYVSLGNTSSINNLPLPIELLSFDAQLKGTYVDLQWETATEINNDYFVIERAGEDLDWEPILTTTGAGNSNSLLNYSEKDRDPLNGLSYYRLKQVDFDGAYTYSDPVSVFNESVTDSEDVFMYPNPSAQGSVFLRLPFATRDFETYVRIFDLSGKQLRETRFDTSSDIFEFRYGNLTPGIYLIQIASSAINETKKLVIE